MTKEPDWSAAQAGPHPVRAAAYIGEVGGSTFKTNPESVQSLLAEIDSGKLVLPEFQRDFRWETERTARLLSSVIARFPTGALLLWSQHRSAGTPAVAARPIEGAPENQAPEFRFILDGQQRLTALYRAVYGVPEDERYFVNLRALLDFESLTLREDDEIDWDAVVVDKELSARERRSLDKRRKEADDPDEVLPEYDTAAYQVREQLFPVHRLRDFDDWLEDDYLPAVAAGADHQALRKALREVNKRRLKYLVDYDYPVVTLDRETSLVAVCRIFETLNRSAVTLGPFELLTAKFFPGGVNLRDLWENARQTHPMLDEFGVDPYAVLQAITLRSRKSAQRAAVLNLLTASDVEEHWDSVVGGIQQSARMLQEDCGVMSAAWLPYQMLLVPLGAVWSDVEALETSQKIEAKRKLQRYFWCTAFTGNFDQGANSQAQADYFRLQAWLQGDDEQLPEAVTDALPIRRDAIESATTRKTALFKAMVALFVRAGARDFYEGDKMTPGRVREHSIEAHHVFPKRWLQDQPFSESPDLALNQTPINKKTNASIGSKPPSAYLASLRQGVRDNDLTPVLESHFMDVSALETDDYSKFLQTRLDAVVAELNELIKPRFVTG